MNIFLVLCCLSTGILSIKSINNLADFGFPNAWDGDKFHNFPCPSETVPRWLDGHFMIQVCGSYGDRKGPSGSKVTHMFDAIGAVISLELKNGEVKFSGLCMFFMKTHPIPVIYVYIFPFGIRVHALRPLMWALWLRVMERNNILYAQTRITPHNAIMFVSTEKKTKPY